MLAVNLKSDDEGGQHLMSTEFHNRGAKGMHPNKSMNEAQATNSGI